MSVEAAKKFIEKVKSDEDFKAQLSAIKNAEERMAFAKNAGFDFTGEEIKEAAGGELSDGDLDAVAGGGASVCGSVCFPFVGGVSADVNV
ncbi:MAG: Nif11-like leader peptide family natural product precursor [Syntrophomonas sp.]